MSKVLCLTHRGVRCCVPAERVLSAEQAHAREDAVSFWDGEGPPPQASGERSLRLETADGPRWLWGSAVRAVSVTAGQIQQLTPVLRGLLTLPHVVGLPPWVTSSCGWWSRCAFRPVARGKNRQN
jgi:hypothetical protein